MSLEPRIVHADEWLAVIEKPAGLVVHGAPGHRGPTLVDLLSDLLAGGDDPQRPGIVHRLDKDTSGLMVVARGGDAHRRLAHQIKAREVRRTYRALVEGHPRSRTGTIDAPWGATTEHPSAGRSAVARRARPAPTSRFSSSYPRTPWSRCAWRPAARIRSGPTSPRSGTRWRVTHVTGMQAATTSLVSSCTAPSWASGTRSLRRS